jgi:dihydrolipoamide dehydrogenase
LTGAVGYDFGRFHSEKNAVIKRLRAGIASLLKSNKIDVIKGTGIIAGSNASNTSIRITAADAADRGIYADNVILAAGARPFKPTIPGSDGENVFYSDDILNDMDILDSYVIIGGGVVGMEFAALFSALGKPVTVLELAPAILPGTDGEIVKALTADMAKKGVKIHTNAHVSEIVGGSPVTVRYTCGQNGSGTDASDRAVSGTVARGAAESAAQAACCVICAGRTPNAEGLGLEKLPILYDGRYISTDGHMRTGAPSIYAVGDVTGKMQLAHVATAQGLAAADNCVKKNIKMRYDIVPGCVYTYPEIAWAGINESVALSGGRRVVTGRAYAAGNGKSIIGGTPQGFVKLTADAVSGEILGAHIYSPNAVEMISEICAVMQSEGTLDELAGAIHPHPSYSEMVMDAARDAAGI